LQKTTEKGSWSEKDRESLHKNEALKNKSKNKSKSKALKGKGEAENIGKSLKSLNIDYLRNMDLDSIDWIQDETPLNVNSTNLDPNNSISESVFVADSGQNKNVKLKHEPSAIDTADRQLNQINN